MLVTQSERGDGKGESKPRNKRRYDEGARDKFRNDGLNGRPGQKLPKRARSDDDDDFDDDEIDDDDDFDLEDDDEFDEDDDFDLDDDDDFAGDDDWEKDDD